ncbi:thioredoxin domain-containing protein [Candidatus Woesebacteria bacterium]|nr:thioredoxin domain-containing protein [Candidatus Woesebacteria bacterium]
MNKKLIVISIVALVGFVVLAYFSTNEPAQTAFPEQAQLRPSGASDSAKLGDHPQGAGKHIMVEYSDLQCPACKSAHDYLKAEKQKDPAFAKIMDEQFTFVYRHFPLVNIHKNADVVARSAEAAAIQGKFYEFIDRAFATQSEWAESDKARELFVNIATDLGLDTDKFDADIDSQAVTDKIGADIQLGEQARIEGTPTFFIDGEKITGFGSFDEFKKIVVDSVQN